MSDEHGPIRIARYLARCGVASRRRSEELITAGRVSVNGEVIHDLGRRVEPGVDTVAVDGNVIGVAGEHVTLVMNKPVGVIVSRNDPEKRATVYDLIPSQYRNDSSRLVYAGRLDVYTSGLLILTTDGELANRLTHPRHDVSKTYEVETDRELTEAELERLRGGLDIGEGEHTSPCEAERLRGVEPRYRLVIHEGRNRQIRRMIEAVEAKTVSLRRTAIGAMSLQSLGLRRSEVKAITREEIEEWVFQKKD